MRTANTLLRSWRVRSGPMASDDSLGMCGAFRIPYEGSLLNVVASDAVDLPETEGWEHVSVSLPDRCPTWEAMCYVKDLFWKSDEWVLQLHPPLRENISYHPYCLHLWRPTRQTIPTPPRILIAPEGKTPCASPPSSARS